MEFGKSKQHGSANKNLTRLYITHWTKYFFFNFVQNININKKSQIQLILKDGDLVFL